MSRSAFGNRVARTALAARTRPLSSAAVDERYAHFLATGELPEDDRIAWAILRRALCARKNGTVTPQPEEGRLTGPPREQVFREAVHPDPTARAAARLLIRLLAGGGHDPTDPEFVPSDCRPPRFGGYAMACLGYPDRWVSPPYAGQLRRVLREHAEIQATLPWSADHYRQAAKALSRFMRHGEIPQDEELRRFALTISEMLVIHVQSFGYGGEEALAAFEAVAVASAEDRPQALQQLGQVMARTVFHGDR